MNTKSNSETDMKTKQPDINFVPTARQGFRTMYWSKCIVLFPCFSLLISAKNFENKLSDCNDGGSKFFWILEKVTVFQSTAGLHKLKKY